MEEKKKKITLRFTENECNQLKSEAEKNGMTVSDHIRGKIFGNQNYFSRRIGEGGQEPSQTTSEILLKVNKELTRMQHDLEQLHGAKKVQVAGLKERVDEVWRLLN